MKNKLINRINLIDISLEITLILLPIIFIYLFVPFQETLVYNTDEGLQLMRAFLLQKGYPLYESIWSDQPPVYTWLLSLWTQIFGKSLARGRELTLLFSLLLLWSFRRIILFYFGRLTSIFALISLLLSQYYLQLSVSVMLAIPSLCLSVVSLFFVIISRSLNRGKIFFLISSGILLGLAIQVKFWVIVLIPVSVIYLIVNGELSLRKIDRSKLLKNCSSMGIWLLGLITSVGLIIWLIQPFPYDQLLNSHFESSIYEKSDLLKMFKVTGILRFDRVLFTFAGIGLFLALLSGKKGINKILIPLLWLSFDLIAFWNHRPIWNHYYPIFSIPLVWLASYCFWWGWSTLRHNFVVLDLKRINLSELLNVPKIMILKYILSIGIIGIFIYSLSSKFNYFSSVGERWKNKSQDLEEIISSISTYQKQTNWIYTDNPILAIHTNLLIPPEVAVVTIKRMRKRGDYEQKLREVLEFYQPEQIIFMVPSYRQLRSNTEIMAYIDKHYKPISKNSEIEHYILKSIDR